MGPRNPGPAMIDAVFIAACAGWILAAICGLRLLQAHPLRARLRHPQGDTGPDRPADDTVVALLFDDRLLLDASPAARVLLGPSPGSHPAPDDWDHAAQVLTPLFPGFPPSPQDIIPGHQRRLAPATPGHVQPLCLTALAGRVRLDLAAETALTHSAPEARRQIAELQVLRRAADHAPLAIWQAGPGARIDWANAAYRALARDLMPDFPAAHGIAPLFAAADLDHTDPAPRRVSVTMPGGKLRWFHITSARSGDSVIHYAHNIDTVVQAETAQRNFVQTLTKTFATLAIGLAIFDRDRRLVMFNPALVDLTALPAGFLSARPSLSAVFDRMRDNQTMPEPRDYPSWRQRLSDMVAAATDGRFLETWVLPGGQTYRVTGRPHPDCAVAFVFEDISAEMTLSRRFRAELGLGKAVLNQLSDAIAVFSGAGVLTLSNRAYTALWGMDPDTAFAETSLDDALRHWRAHSRCDDGPADLSASGDPDACNLADWDQVQAWFHNRTASPPAARAMRLASGPRVIREIVTLPGGSLLVRFTPDTRPAIPALVVPA